MGWNGAIIGGCVGSWLGKLPGIVIGGLLGHFIEEFGKSGKSAQKSPDVVFCASAAAMLAKMAKADGRISKVEISAVEAAFARLGFSRAARSYAIDVFRKAKDDSHSIYEYAGDFASVVGNGDVRVIFYEMLWDIACADGDLSVIEKNILERITPYLKISSEWFGVFYRERFYSSSHDRSAYRQDDMADAYSQLGVSPSASDDEVRKAYRSLAKRYHPDTLKAQGLPEEMVARANERMSKINAAWSAVKKERGL
ncbi:MAG: co-chaperone DjlA [Kiritimatiellae bacterium]|nr:co-chaperone DjlA [Kiritimatiellia bacterium]